jgi:hypothetical protein
MTLLTITEAAREKGCTRQAIHCAIARGCLTAQRVGHGWVIHRDDKYTAYQPRRRSSDSLNPTQEQP